MGPNVNPNTAGLPFALSFSTIATYSLAAAVLVQVAGFVIATQHYSRAGVGARSVPLHQTLAAGVAFAVITAYCVYVGVATGVMSKSVQTWGDGVELFLYEVFFIGAFYGLLVAFLLRWPGTGAYVAICAIVGLVFGRFGAPRYLPTLAPDRFSVPDLPRAFISLIAALWLFARLVYPNLSRALGGGAPLPVRINLAPGYEDLIPAGAEVYEVHSTSESLFLELVFRPEHPSAEPLRGEVSWNSPTATSPPQRIRYLQIPAAAARSIERLHPFHSAPPHGSGSLVQPELTKK